MMRSAQRSENPISTAHNTNNRAEYPGLIGDIIAGVSKDRLDRHESYGTSSCSLGNWFNIRGRGEG